MKKQFLLLFFALLLLFEGCSYVKAYLQKEPEIMIRKDFSGEGIAVLTFTKQGNLSNDLGRLAADKLSDAFFLSGKFNIIDRAKINEAQEDMEINNTDFLSSDQIQQLGLKLKANYLILGRIQQGSLQDNFELNSEQQLNISFRVISVANTEVIGVASLSKEFKGNIQLAVDEMVKQIVKKIGG